MNIKTNFKTTNFTILKTVNKKHTLTSINTTIFIFINITCCIVFSLVLLLALFPIISHGKTTKPTFDTKYNTVYIGKTYKYNIVNPPQKSKIKFTVSNKKIATINPDSGILYPRQKGIVTVKAVITDIKKNQKLTIKKIVKIKNLKNGGSNSEIPFSLPSSYVNNINYTVKLKATKILQTSQVKASYIQLSKKNCALKGQFKKLSSDGRYITYELNNEAVKQLTPGDRTMDGTYTMSCSLSSRKLSITYIEHLVGQSVTGFITTPNGKPVENAVITLSNDNFSVNTISDKYGYYNIRFPKPETVILTVSCEKYYTHTLKDIYLKISKSVCKNIVMHNANVSDKNNIYPSAYFNISTYDKQPAKIEISSYDINNKIMPDNTHAFTTDLSGRLFVSSNNKLLKEQTSTSQYAANIAELKTNGEAEPTTPELIINHNLSDADIVNFSSNNNFISHKEKIELKSCPVISYPFSYQNTYYIKIFSSANNSLQPDHEFYFSFDDFTSCNIVFNITLTSNKKTIYSSSLLPLKPGSNINLENINYYKTDLYQIGISSPLCSFNFCENTPADFKSGINSVNLNLKNGDFYYAVFKILDYANTPISFEILSPFKVKDGDIFFENSSLIFSDENLADTKLKQLPPLFDIIVNAGLLTHDNSYKNTILCTYDSYGKIKNTFFTSLSSPLLQKKLSNASSGYILYTDSESFDIGV